MTRKQQRESLRRMADAIVENSIKISQRLSGFDIEPHHLEVATLAESVESLAKLVSCVMDFIAEGDQS